MLRKLIQSTGAIFLSLLLLLGSYSKEALHTFAAHHDTEHDYTHHCPHGESHIEPPHHHCSFLSFVLMPFMADAVWPAAPLISQEHYQSDYPQWTSAVMSIPHSGLWDRGPPAASRA